MVVSIAARPVKKNRGHTRFPSLSAHDPAGYIEGLSLYEYVQSNPITYTDPTGLCMVADPNGTSASILTGGYTFQPSCGTTPTSAAQSPLDLIPIPRVNAGGLLGHSTGLPPIPTLGGMKLGQPESGLGNPLPLSINSTTVGPAGTYSGGTIRGLTDNVIVPIYNGSGSGIPPVQYSMPPAIAAAASSSNPSARACGKPTCGPDVTQWFTKELANELAYAKNEFGPAAAAVALGANLANFATFAETKLEMAEGREYKGKVSSAGGDIQKPATAEEGCPHTVTLAGKCTRIKNLGNIALGFMTQVISEPVMDTAFTVVNSFSANNRQWDSYKAGKALAQTKTFGDVEEFAKIVNGFSNQQFWKTSSDFNSWTNCEPSTEKYEGPHYITDADIAQSEKDRKTFEELLRIPAYPPPGMMMPM